jgi:predicted CopG family antitoxin
MTKVISISDEAYEELKKIKDGMSFTEIIINLAKKERLESIMRLAGTITEEEGDEMLKEIKKIRKLKSRRFQ